MRRNGSGVHRGNSGVRRGGGGVRRNGAGANRGSSGAGRRGAGVRRGNADVRRKESGTCYAVGFTIHYGREFLHTCRRVDYTRRGECASSLLTAVLPMNLIGLIAVPALGAALASGNFSGWRDMGWGG